MASLYTEFGAKDRGNIRIQQPFEGFATEEGEEKIVNRKGNEDEYTVRVDSLPDRKWREIQQQPGTAGPGNMLAVA